MSSFFGVSLMGNISRYPANQCANASERYGKNWMFSLCPATRPKVTCAMRWCSKEIYEQNGMGRAQGQAKEREQTYEVAVTELAREKKHSMYGDKKRNEPAHGAGCPLGQILLIRSCQK